MSTLSALAPTLSTRVQNLQSEISSVQTELASGLRTLNPGERGVVTRLSAQVAGYNTVQNNIAFGQNIVGVAQTGLTSIASIIQQMRGLATQASSAGLSVDDLTSLNTTFQSLKTQVSNIANSATVNGSNLLKPLILTSQSQSDTYLYINILGSSQGVKSYKVGANGTLSLANSVDIPGSASITVNPAGTYLYAGSGYNGNTISEFSIGIDGTLTPLSPPSVTAGLYPYVVTINPAGTYAYVNNVRDGTIGMYSIGNDGVLSLLSTPTIATNYPQYPLAITPDGKYAYSPNYMARSISMYSIGNDGVLVPLSTPTIATSTLPATITINPAGTYAYVKDNSGGNNLLTFSIGSNGVLTQVDSNIINGMLKITINPAGTLAYISKYIGGVGTIEIYSIGNNGSLTASGLPTVTTGAGSNPNLIINPSGTNAYAMSSLDSKIYMYSIGSDGSLVPSDPASLGVQNGSPGSFSPAFVVKEYPPIQSNASSSIQVQTSISGEGGTTIQGQPADATSLGIDTLNILNVTNGKAAIQALVAALNSVSNKQSALSAYSVGLVAVKDSASSLAIGLQGTIDSIQNIDATALQAKLQSLNNQQSIDYYLVSQMNSASAALLSIFR
ncbi:beta-propeller fold lactonase family protein [Polynucleobacter paneuropaeus]|uniref:Flagellin N-terminal domain-containing protein n=1 Tax=Polynucleobacter paneuropaeus TaxID=2527775 RepID=A0A2Z4JRP2_9BURK|nr:beta-propeller fold lactonase family protein [Polynucleobacter paneuropaeus]AWW49450.1 hypothetical protein Pas1_03075 [Polynucleobacter paneuropaeus]